MPNRRPGSKVPAGTHPKLNEKWQALIALHRTLHEHHDPILRKCRAPEETETKKTRVPGLSANLDYQYGCVTQNFFEEGITLRHQFLAMPGFDI
jgi:hypothetical protein